MMLATLALSTLLSGDTSAQKPEGKDDTGSAVTAKDAGALVDYHNKVRKDVGVGPVKWSKDLAKYAQVWADRLAESGELEHRPAAGEFAQKYGENLAINATILQGAEDWYSEIKDYTQGTAIPEDFSKFKSGHYTQMVWQKSVLIGAGSAVVRKGPFKGSLVIVCNYDPPGNYLGEKPY